MKRGIISMAVQIRRNRDNGANGNNDKENALFFKQTKCNARIVHQGNVENIFDNGNRFTGGEYI